MNARFLGGVSFLPFRSVEDGGAGGGGGPGGGDSNSQASGGSEAPAWAKSFEENVKTLAQGIAELNNLAKQRAQAAQQPPQQQEPEEEDEPEPSPTDLETMDRAEYARYITGQVIKELKTVLKPVEQKVNQVDQTVVAQRLATEVTELSARHKDFYEWQDEMLAIQRENPTLSVSRLYALAKAENPAKATELAKKYSADGGDASDGSKQQEKKTLKVSFGGFAPNGSGAASANRKMAPREAAIAAWDQVVGELGTPDFQD